MVRNSNLGSFRLGSYQGIELRLHLSTVLASLALVWACQDLAGSLRTVVLCYTVITWLLAVVWHESGHLRALMRCRSRLTGLTLTPFGLHYQVDLPPEPQDHFHLALSGCAMSFLGLFCSTLLLFFVGAVPQEWSFNLTATELFQETRSIVLLKFFAGWNAFLLLNLFPAFPLDGGYALWSVLWPVFGRRGAAAIVTRSMLMTSVGLFALAIFLPANQLLGPGIPLWIFPTVCGLVLLYSAQFHWDEFWSTTECKQEYLSDLNLTEKPHSLTWQMNVSLRSNSTAEQSHPTAPEIPARSVEQTTATIEFEASSESPGELQLDAILSRLNVVGYAELSEAERQFLDQESARLRRRRQS